MFLDLTQKSLTKSPPYINKLLGACRTCPTNSQQEQRLSREAQLLMDPVSNFLHEPFRRKSPEKEQFPV